jgi:hypothetical protein
MPIIAISFFRVSVFTLLSFIDRWPLAASMLFLCRHVMTAGMWFMRQRE